MKIFPRREDEAVHAVDTKLLCNTSAFFLSRVPNVSLFRVDFDAEAFSNGLYSELGVAFPPEMIRAVRKRKAEYLAGRYACQQLLREKGLPTQVRSGAHRQPLWPPGLVGSITHIDDVAVAAIAEQRLVAALGIDLARWLDDAHADSIAKMVVDNCEYCILSRSKRTHAELITIAFSCKEAFFKAAYYAVGRYFEFENVKIIHFDWHGRRFVLEVASALSARIPAGRIFDGLFFTTASSVFTVIAEACR